MLRHLNQFLQIIAKKIFKIPKKSFIHLKNYEL